MLKKVNRGLKRSDFEKSRSEGKLIQSPLFAVSVVKNEKETKQFGFVISKKISKSAVVRNKIRRIMAEAARKNLEMLKANSKIIFLAKRSLIGKKPTEVEAEIVKIFGKLDEKNRPATT